MAKTFLLQVRFGKMWMLLPHKGNKTMTKSLLAAQIAAQAKRPHTIMDVVYVYFRQMREERIRKQQVLFFWTFREAK